MERNDTAIKMFQPIQLTWSNGAVISENVEQLPCHVVTKAKKPTEVNDIIAGSDQNGFIGKRNESALSNNYIVLRNRKTGHLRWHKTTSFLMQPYKRKVGNKETTVLDDQESKRAATSNLNKAMGSKKIKRRVMESEKMNVTTENLEEQLKTAIKDKVLVVEKPTNILPSQKFPLLPPRNNDALVKEEVYQVHDLISSDIMDSMNEWTEYIINSDIPTLALDNRISTFFTRCYGALNACVIAPAVPDQKKVKLLLYADSLLKFVQVPARKLKLKTLVICTYSSSLNAKILNEFCDLGVGNVRQRSASMRDKAYCHILVCLFLALNYLVDISVFSKEMSSTDFSRLSTLMRVVGATKEKDSSTQFRLKLPLAELPSSQSGRTSGGFNRKKK